MSSEAYKEWTELFDSNVSEVWKSERKELQRTVMLLWTLQKELKNVHENLESEVSNLRQQLSNKDCLEKKTKLSCNRDRKKSPNSGNKENRLSSTLLETGSANYASNITELESPDLFRNNDPSRDTKPDNEQESSTSMIVDLSYSSDDDKKEIEHSPTLISKRRKDPRRYKSRLLQEDTPEMNKCEKKNLVRNIFRTPRSDLEMSVIDSTPVVRSMKLKTGSKVGEFNAKKKALKKRRNLTLTQIYPNSMKFKSNNDEKKLEVAEDSDETYFEANKSNSKMGITDILSFINKDETNKDCTFSDMEEMDSTQETDQFSKGALFEESACLREESPQKKLKLAVLPEPVVRGHARKDLNGFACDKCRNFYGRMNLSPEELQKKMDECSKHRYKYQPPEDTLPGLWDLTIAPRE